MISLPLLDSVQLGYVNIPHFVWISEQHEQTVLTSPPSRTVVNDALVQQLLHDPDGRVSVRGLLVFH